MLFIVLPLSFVDRTASVVKDSFSVSLTLKEISLVTVVLGILRFIFSPQDPDMCAFAMLPKRKVCELRKKNGGIIFDKVIQTTGYVVLVYFHTCAPFSHFPTYCCPSFSHFIVPSPCLRLFLHSPVYTLPEG